MKPAKVRLENPAIVLGTRPEMVKMSPLIWECQRLGLSFFMVHTGQHYSYEMDQIFFEELSLPPAKYDLGVGSGRHGEQTAKMLAGIEEILHMERPDLLIVEGDTNTILAAALAAVKMHIPVGHVEAGLRSHDRNMPEEINRVVSDHLSQFLFAPTNRSKANLLAEGIPPERIFVTGNTIVDVVHRFAGAVGDGALLTKLGLSQGQYFLVTAHREENVDHRERLEGILEGLGLVHQEFRLPLVFPIHPRTQNRLKQFGLSVPAGVELMGASGYREFLQLEANAKLVLTDSGGVQEEACILGVPCVTLRDNTERPETVEAGANILTGCRPQAILRAVRRMVGGSREWRQPFGDGRAGERIVDIIHNRRSIA